MEASILLNVGDAGEVPSGLQVAAIVAKILPKATPAIARARRGQPLAVSRGGRRVGAAAALARRRAKDCCEGQKEDKDPSSLFDPHRHHTLWSSTKRLMAAWRFGNGSEGATLETALRQDGEKASLCFAIVSI
jgi:hypothetical protein